MKMCRSLQYGLLLHQALHDPDGFAALMKSDEGLALSKKHNLADVLSLALSWRDHGEEDLKRLTEEWDVMDVKSGRDILPTKKEQLFPKIQQC
ncbi:hypothetical protein WDW86_00485 [Bdellovibrionota bacterium FG-2]